MNNTSPLLASTERHLPARSIRVAALRRPGTPLIIQCVVPGDGRFKRREDLEPVEDPVKAFSAEFSRDVNIRLTVPWRTLDEVEDWIESAAWHHGAWDIQRLSNPPDIDPSSWRERPGNGIGIMFGGLSSVYSISGDESRAHDDNNDDLAEEAATKGWWTWGWKPNKSWQCEPAILGSARRGAPELAEDGSRPTPFPGWIRDGEYQGRSGEWWYGLMKSYETSDEPGLVLRCVWDLRTRRLNLNA